ncbi:MAG: hypothetical protein ACE367_04610 [Acidimicrobiales bacterium]
MQRPTVRVTRMRIKDLRPGDVVNKDPEAMQGWFAVTELRPLHDGSVSVVAKVITLTFSGYPDDLVGVQVLVPMDFPAPPVPAQSSPAPAVGPAPAAAGAPQTAPAPAPAAAPARATAPTPTHA